MKKAISLSLMLLLLTVMAVTPVTGQNDANVTKKSWKQWSKKEAEKILSDSPWAQLQVDTDTSEMFFQPTNTGPRAPNSSSRLEQGATNQAVSLTYGIRFFSSRPVRRAFIRMIQVQRKDLEADVVARMNNFAELPSAESIIIAVTLEGTDKRYLGKAMQIIDSAVTGTLRNGTYLERNDGKRVFLEEYVPPGKDGFGARFIFPRMVDERPFLTTEYEDVRFVAEYGTSIKLNMRFKLSDMMLDGKLEY